MKNKPNQTEDNKNNKKRVFETFRVISAYDINNLTHSEPYCFNGEVNIRKYRVTVEEIEEPKEILETRLQYLWRTSDNFHHHRKLYDEAKKLGFELDRSEFGKDRKVEKR